MNIHLQNQVNEQVTYIEVLSITAPVCFSTSMPSWGSSYTKF